jgi:aminoglycoside phosphotransferase (APT) family kinase protein
VPAATAADPQDQRDRIALAVVVEVAKASGLDVTGARVARSATSVLVELPGERLVARLDDIAGVAVAERQVLVARALDERDVPAVRLAGLAVQPVRTAVGAITFWEREELVPAPVEPVAVALLAHRLHAAFRDAAAHRDLPVLDPLRAVRDQLDRARSTSGDDEVTVLADVATRLSSAWDRVVEADPAGTTLVHGDLHGHNVLSTTRGPVLGDLELAGTGPASYDLVPQLVLVRRYGAPMAGYEAFARAYGWDVRTWEGHVALAEVYELWVTAWAVGNRHRSARHAEEAARRLDRWLDPDRPGAPWQLL